MKSLPKAVIFDLDGTLVVSTVDFMKFRKRLLDYIKTKGADMRDYDLSQMIVVMISKFESEMRRKGVPEEVIQGYLDDIEKFLNEIELERIDETVPMPGAEELLRALREKGVKIGVLTRGCPEYAEKALKISGLDRYVDAVVARDRKSGISPKPSVQSAEAILKKLDVTPDEAVMVGDYSIDFVCARDSRIRFIGLSSGERSKADLKNCGCRDIAENLEEVGRLLGL
jgi:phosphoglycolate phosphatase-like HAD superfamily hydrolase